MWGRRRKPKRGGQLARQLALGRLEDALAEVDGAQEDSAQIEERRREQIQREDTEPDKTEPPAAAAGENSQVSA